MNLSADVLNKIFLAIIQGATEFLPISSSGHLAIISNLISGPDLFFFTVLHLASLIAVIIFTRKEIINLCSFRKEYRKLWLYIIIATIPAALAGFFFNNIVEKAFTSLRLIGIAYIFTAIILFLTKFSKNHSLLNSKNAIVIGVFQVLALLPGVSRSGITISTALFMGIDREKAAKFSFLLFIPLCIGAFILETGKHAYFNISIAISFIVCLISSLAFLNLLLFIIKKSKLWVFSAYCILIGLTSIIIGR